MSRPSSTQVHHYQHSFAFRWIFRSTQSDFCKSRFITLINSYFSANFINSYTSQHVDHKSLSLLDALCQRGSQPFIILLLLKRKRKRNGCTWRKAQIVHNIFFVSVGRITFRLNDFWDAFAKLRKVTFISFNHGRLSAPPSVLMEH